MSEKDMSALLSLEQQLQSNPSSYDTHLQVCLQCFYDACALEVGLHSLLKGMQYIELLRSARLATKLRTARTAMQDKFPLTEALWLDWLNDESAAGSDWEYMQGLFNKATQDYLSVSIWENYLRCSIVQI